MNYILYGYQSSSSFKVRLPQGLACFNYTYKIGIRIIDNNGGIKDNVFQLPVKEELSYSGEAQEVFEENRKVLNEGNFQDTCQTVIRIATYFNHLNLVDKESLSKFKYLNHFL